MWIFFSNIDKNYVVKLIEAENMWSKMGKMTTFLKKIKRRWRHKRRALVLSGITDKLFLRFWSLSNKCILICNQKDKEIGIFLMQSSDGDSFLMGCRFRHFLHACLSQFLCQLAAQIWSGIMLLSPFCGYKCGYGINAVWWEPYQYQIKEHSCSIQFLCRHVEHVCYQEH